MDSNLYRKGSLAHMSAASVFFLHYCSMALPALRIRIAGVFGRKSDSEVPFFPHKNARSYTSHENVRSDSRTAVP